MTRRILLAVIFVDVGIVFMSIGIVIDGLCIGTWLKGEITLPEITPIILAPAILSGFFILCSIAISLIEIASRPRM
jgi:hypothetical protein